MAEKQKGIVVKSTGSFYLVRIESGEIVPCNLKGKFRIQGIKTTNPIAVGDIVCFVRDPDSERGLVTHIEPRKNYIARKSINLSKITHILAANIDCLFLVISLNKPKTPLGFIDRFLTAAEAFRIETILIFNKIDIYDEAEMLQLEKMQELYSKIGYTCLSMSAKENIGLEELKQLMKGKVSLFGGKSGVGKSSIINALDNRLNLKVEEISASYEQGKHTTTFAEMFELSFGGYIIDSPGIKEFGLIQYKKEEVSHYFPEMLRLLDKCKFNNCIHIHEPQCAVKKAVEDGIIAPSRYRNYVSIIENEDINLKDWMLE